MFEILFEHNSKAFNYMLSPYILCCLLAYTCDSKSHSSTFSMPFNRCIKVYWAYNEETSYKLEISMEKKWHEHFQWSQLINIQRRSLISSAVVFDIIRLDRFMFSYKEPRLIFFSRLNEISLKHFSRFDIQSFHLLIYFVMNCSISTVQANAL